MYVQYHIKNDDAKNNFRKMKKMYNVICIERDHDINVSDRSEKH